MANFWTPVHYDAWSGTPAASDFRRFTMPSTTSQRRALSCACSRSACKRSSPCLSGAGHMWSREQFVFVNREIQPPR
jgi:hypothetical protein